MHKLVYTDEQDLRIYESLPSTDFKEFFMAYFKYKKGDKVELTDFTNPVTFALFNSYIPKLDKNEDTYNKKVQANKENGKKGGRPKKSVITEVENNEFEIEHDNTHNMDNSNISDFKPSNTPQVSMPQQEEEKPTEEPKTPNKDITHMTKPNDMDNMETTPISTDDIEEEFETDEQKYGSRVMDFVDRYYDILENIVKAKVINTLTPTTENSLVSQSADIKLKDLVIEYGFTDNEKPHLIQLLNDWRDETINKQNEVVAA